MDILPLALELRSRRDRRQYCAMKAHSSQQRAVTWERRAAHTLQKKIIECAYAVPRKLCAKTTHPGKTQSIIY